MVKHFRPVRTPVHFSKIFQREGIIDRKRAKLNVSQLHDASIFLFKHILNPADVRWNLALKYADLKASLPLSPISLENGMRANYASKSQGRNKAYGASIVGQIHVTQLARALRNIEMGNRYFEQRRPLSLGGLKYELRFAKTDSILKKLNKYGVSGCPEALWQLQLWSPKGYLGRIGVNFHSENGKKIVTISNIQGAVGKKAEQKEFESLMGRDFGTELIKRLQQTLGPNFEYRGVTPNNHNQVMYRMAFRKSSPEKIKIWSTESKQMIEDRRTIK